jgi:hypothetical protein
MSDGLAVAYIRSVVGIGRDEAMRYLAVVGSDTGGDNADLDSWVRYGWRFPEGWQGQSTTR